MVKAVSTFFLLIVMMRIFLAGASRGVGREVAKQLVVAGYSVTALLRGQTGEGELAAMGVSVVKGDALEADTMARAIASCSPEAVISTVGGLPDDSGVRVDYVGNKNLIDGAKAAGVKRFILVSSIGADDSAQALPAQALETLGSVLKEKERAEAYLAKSGLSYTVIRPGGLLSQPATGQEYLTEDAAAGGSIPRSAVANLIVQCLDSDRAVNKIFSAIDRSMQRTNADAKAVEL